MTTGEISAVVGLVILSGRGAIWLDTWIRARNKIDQKTIDGLEERIQKCERSCEDWVKDFQQHSDRLKKIGNDCSTGISNVTGRINQIELSQAPIAARVTILWDAAVDDRRHYKRRENDGDPRDGGNGRGDGR